MRALLLYWVPVLVWMSLIFTASSDRGSFQHSSRIIGPLVQWLVPQISAEALHTIVVVVRKGAHVTEYAVLACLVWRALRILPRQEAASGYWLDALRTLMLVMLYAASDEFHQRFVPSREASVRDVLIDTGGGLLALLVLWGLHAWQSRRRSQGSCRVDSSPGSPQSEV